LGYLGRRAHPGHATDVAGPSVFRTTSGDRSGRLLARPLGPVAKVTADPLGSWPVEPLPGDLAAGGLRERVVPDRGVASASLTRVPAKFAAPVLALRRAILGIIKP